MTSLDQRAEAALVALDEKPRGVWPKPIDLGELAKHEPQQPRFLIPDWLPAGYATLLAGHGGAGKSAIALQVAVALATGGQFAGIQATQRRVLYLSCEDRTEVLHWRLSRLCAHLGLSLADLQRDLKILDLVKYDTILWTPHHAEQAALTDAYQDLLMTVVGESPEVLIVDGISDTFGGKEIERAQVRAFISSLVRLVPDEDGAVLLIGHVDKAGANNRNGHGFSGSTAWHNSVRARWYLAPETSDDPGSDMILELKKANSGAVGKEIRFAWSNAAGLFVGRAVKPETELDRAAKDRAERNGIMDAIRAVHESGDFVPAATQGPRTALHVLSQRPEFPDTIDPENKADKRRFWRLIEGLRQIREIEEVSIRRTNRHPVAAIVPQTQQ